MAALLQAYLGPGLVLVFCLSQALRDVYFGHVFQGVDFFAVILIAFVLSTLLFAVVVWRQRPGDVRKLRAHAGTVLAINLTTALAWSCYFFGLTQVEPSIANTLHSGMAPLTVIALAAFGVHLAKTGAKTDAKSEAVGWLEYFGYAGMALALAALCWVVLSGHSGLAHLDPVSALAALALLAVSGTSITVSLLYCKRLHDLGVSPEVVTAVRYGALILVAAGVLLWQARPVGIDTPSQFATLALLATVLIVLPLYVMQIGIARTAPLTAHVLRSLGPVFVFAAQQLDGRLTYSRPVLLCILVYSAFAIVSNLAHGWRDSASAAAGAARLEPARSN